MKKLALVLFVALTANAGSKQTLTGVITDTMCGTNHASMKAGPAPDCVKACVKPGGKWKYALHDGKRAWVLSDQQTPEKFAGKKVAVTGVLFERTGIIQVLSIAEK